MSVSKTTAKEMSPANYLVNFIVLSYALSAPWWLLGAALRNTSLPLDIPISDIGAVFMPLVAVVILEKSRDTTIQQLFTRAMQYKRVHIQWYVVAALVPFAVFATIYGVMIIQGLPFPGSWHISISAIIAAVVILLIGAVTEEVVYTASLTSRLGAQWNGIVIGLAIGLPWAVWHIPSMLKQGRTWEWIMWGVAGTIAFRIIYVWLYGSSHGSVLAAIIMHFVYNLGRTLFPSDSLNTPLVDYPSIHYGVIIGIVFVIVAVAGRWMSSTRMSVARLGG